MPFFTTCKGQAEKAYWGYGDKRANALIRRAD
jgi:hypothetical protein